MTAWVQKRRPDGTFDLVPRAELSAWMEHHYPDKCRKGSVKFKMVERGRWRWIKSKLIRIDGEGPKRARGLQIIKDIEPFQNVAIDGKVVGGRKQRRDMMRAHGLVEVGNEKPREHPRDTAAKRFDRPMRDIVDSLKKNSQGKWL